MTLYWKIVPAGSTPGEGAREPGPRGGLLAEGRVRAHTPLAAFLASDELHATLATTPAERWEVVSFPGARAEPDPSGGDGAVTVIAGDVAERAAPLAWLDGLAADPDVAPLARPLADAARAEPLSRGPEEGPAEGDGPARPAALDDVVTAAAAAKDFFDDFGQRSGWFSPTDDVLDAPVRVQYVAETREAPDEIEVCFVTSPETEPDGDEAVGLAGRYLDALHAWDPRFRAWRFVTRIVA